MKTVISLAAALLIGDAQAQRIEWGALKKCDSDMSRNPHIVENNKGYEEWCIHACHSLPDGKHPQWTDWCAKLTGGAAKELKKEEDELRAETKKSNDKEAHHWENKFDSKRDDIARWEKKNAALKKEMMDTDKLGHLLNKGMHEMRHAKHEMKKYEHHANKDGQELGKIRDEEDHTKYNTAAWKVLHAKEHQLRNEWRAMNDKADIEQNKVEAIRYGHHQFQHAHEERNKYIADVGVNKERIHELRRQEHDIEKRWAEVFHKTPRGIEQGIALEERKKTWLKRANECALSHKVRDAHNQDGTNGCWYVQNTVCAYLARQNRAKYVSQTHCLNEWKWEHGGIDEFANTCSSNLDDVGSQCTQEWERQMKNGQGPVNQNDQPIREVQLADDTESYVGTSAVAVTGIVIGASFFIMQKSRSAGKADHELSLIEK